MKVGYIGLGTMGGPMALNLLKAKHEVFVHDLDEDTAKDHIMKGATWTKSPAEMAQKCSVVFTSLPGPAEMKAVALGNDGLIEGFSPEVVILILPPTPRLSCVRFTMKWLTKM